MNTPAQIRVSSESGWSIEAAVIAAALCRYHGTAFLDRAAVADTQGLIWEGVTVIAVTPLADNINTERGYVYFAHRAMYDIPFNREVTLK